MSDTEVTPRFKKGASADTDPDAFMMKAKEALSAQRTEVEAKLKQVQEELDGIQAKLDRIENYFNPTATREPAPRTPRQPRKASTGPRAPRDSGVRDRILAKIKEHPDGIKAAALIEAMGGKDDKKVEMQVRNAVTALKKVNQITAENGVYKAV